MLDHLLSADTQAILLLCGSFGRARSNGAKPLTLPEYNQLAVWLQQHNLRPADLLNAGGLSALSEFQHASVSADRLAQLLARGATLALAVESWTNKGLWVISRSDGVYPGRLKTKLGRAAPAVLYGAGSVDLLSKGGLAIVGSRDAEAAATHFTREVARICAGQGIQVISGGARGVDTEAMTVALESGGRGVAVLADSLLKMSVSGRYREGIRSGQLALTSPYDPDAVFNVGNAMGRNRDVYALSDWAMVVSAALNEGGTWAGAVENLKHSWVPLFVRADAPLPLGNQGLIDKGGISVTLEELSRAESLRNWLSTRAGEPRPDEPPHPADSEDTGQQLSLL
jgi:predicted Rossmann fold nucleotide-binding protein DprA/Smf involved in DNA uptake